MNRAQRRAAERGKVKHLFLTVSFTPDEAELMEEALHMYLAYFEEELGDVELGPHQKWAKERAGAIGRALRAAIENRTHWDEGERHAPPREATEPPPS